MTKELAEPFDGIALAVFGVNNGNRCLRWINEARGMASVDFANQDDAWDFRRAATRDILTERLDDLGSWRWMSKGRKPYRGLETDCLCYDIYGIHVLLDAYRRAAGTRGTRAAVDGMRVLCPSVIPEKQTERTKITHMIGRASSAMANAEAKGRAEKLAGSTWYIARSMGGPVLKSIPDLVTLLRRLGCSPGVMTESALRALDAEMNETTGGK